MTCLVGWASVVLDSKLIWSWLWGGWTRFSVDLCKKKNKNIIQTKKKEQNILWGWSIQHISFEGLVVKYQKQEQQGQQIRQKNTRITKAGHRRKPAAFQLSTSMWILNHASPMRNHSRDCPDPVPHHRLTNPLTIIHPRPSALPPTSSSPISKYNTMPISYFHLFTYQSRVPREIPLQWVSQPFFGQFVGETCPSVVAAISRCQEESEELGVGFPVKLNILSM